MTRLALLLVFLLAPPMVQAQIDSTPAGSCAPAQAEAFLDVGNVRARILNDGSLFSRGDGGGYEVPKGTKRHAMYAATLWVAGRVRVAGEGGPTTDTLATASTYGPYEFWPGPLAADGTPPADCAPYDRLYGVTRADIERYEATGAVTDDLRDWPYVLGAPVVDGDGDPSNYDLAGGDRPALLGDQMVWWVMNDAGNVHRRTESRPLGLEVQGTAFAFDAPGVLGLTTFYRYRLRYRGPVPLDDAYVGIWADPDVGYANDDEYGFSGVLNVAYAANFDAVDGTGPSEGTPFGYGNRPPAVGVAMLHGLRKATSPGQETGTTFVCEPFLLFRNYPPVQIIYNQLRHLHPDGQQPPWPCYNTRGRDVHFLLSTGPFRLAPGEEDEVVFAVVWSQGLTNTDSAVRLRADVQLLRDRLDAILTPFSTPMPVGLESPLPDAPARELHTYPNPFTDRTTIRYSLPVEASVRLAVYDVLGREVARLVDGRQGAGIHTATVESAEWPAGVYVARLEAEGRIRTTTLLHMR